MAGEAALRDLCSNPGILQSLITTRSKLNEWSEALQAAAAAAVARPAAAATAVPGVLLVAGAEQLQPGVTAAAAAALPLAPWAWPFSSSCGCRASSANRSSSSGDSAAAAAAAAGGAALSEATAQLLHSQRPPLQACLQELCNNAASVYRRVTIWIRS